VLQDTAQFFGMAAVQAAAAIKDRWAKCSRQARG